MLYKEGYPYPHSCVQKLIRIPFRPSNIHLRIYILLNEIGIRIEKHRFLNLENWQFPNFVRHPNTFLPLKNISLREFSGTDKLHPTRKLTISQKLKYFLAVVFVTSVSMGDQPCGRVSSAVAGIEQNSPNLSNTPRKSLEWVHRSNESLYRVYFTRGLKISWKVLICTRRFPRTSIDTHPCVKCGSSPSSMMDAPFPPEEGGKGRDIQFSNRAKFPEIFKYLL